MREQSAGRATLNDPLMQASAHHVVDVSEPANCWMVPQAGLEPALLSKQDFESSASTNSTTGARHSAYSAVIKTRNG